MKRRSLRALQEAISRNRDIKSSNMAAQAFAVGISADDMERATDAEWRQLDAASRLNRSSMVRVTDRPAPSAETRAMVLRKLRQRERSVA